MLSELSEGAWVEEWIHDGLIEVTRHQRLVSGTIKGSWLRIRVFLFSSLLSTTARVISIGCYHTSCYFKSHFTILRSFKEKILKSKNITYNGAVESLIVHKVLEGQCLLSMLVIPCSR